MTLKTQYALPAFALILAVSAQAQTTTNALDNAGNYTSWPQTANSGSGFSSWTYNNTTPNGGFSGQFLGASPGINSGSGNAFGFYANSAASAESQASLSFTQGSLTANQTFSIQMQNGNITDNGGQVGFNLRDGSGNNIAQFYFNGGASDYYLNIWTSIASGTQIDTGVGYSSGPLTMNFTQEAGDAWSFSLYTGNTLAATLSSTSTGDSEWNNAISQVDMFSLNGGASRTLGDNGNLYFNNLQVTTSNVPEPATMALAALSGLASLAILRRRQ